MYKLWFYIDDEMHVETFNTMKELNEFVENYEVEVFKIC